jgi:hypothetical protein
MVGIAYWNFRIGGLYVRHWGGPEMVFVINLLIMLDTVHFLRYVAYMQSVESSFFKWLLS